MSEEKVIYEAPAPAGWTEEEWATYRRGLEEEIRMRAEAAEAAGEKSWLDDDDPFIDGITPGHPED